MRFKELIKSHNPYEYLIAFGSIHFLLIPIIFLKKGTIELTFNLFVEPEFFNFFYLLTLIGDGWFLVPCILFIFVYSKYNNLNYKIELINFIIISLIMLILTSIFKQLLFPEVMRPIKYFSSVLDENWNVNNFDLTFHRFKSFPSGHTTSASICGFFIMRYFKNIYSRLLIYIIILFVGLSRVFLFQHFIIDVYVGVILGIICVFLGDEIIKKYTKNE